MENEGANHIIRRCGLVYYGGADRNPLSRAKLAVVVVRRANWWLTWVGGATQWRCVVDRFAQHSIVVVLACWFVSVGCGTCLALIIAMEFYQYQPQCSPVSTSSQASSTSSSDDELGLKGLVQGVYAPYLTAELERLFVVEVSFSVSRSAAVSVRLHNQR